MKDLLINRCGDLAIENGDLVWTDGGDQIKQAWLIHIRTFLGEWFLNTERGVPYIQEIFQKNVGRQRLQDIFRTASLEVEGITAVNQVTVGDIDPVSRSVDITVDATLSTGAAGVFQYAGPLDPSNCPISPESDFPATLGDLRMWFDAQDSSALTYDPGVAFTMENKAATGGAEVTSFYSGYPKWVPGINSRRSILSASGGTPVFPITDTPAILTAPKSFTIAIVLQNTVTTGTTQHVFGLSGYSMPGPTYECYYIRFVPRAAGSHTLNLWSDTSPGVSYSYSYDYVPPGSRTAPRIFVIALDASVPDLTFYSDFGGYYNTAINPLAVRNLNGGGTMLAGYASDCKTPLGSFDGYVGEVMLYAGVMNATNRGLLQTYLATKWGF